MSGWLRGLRVIDLTDAGGLLAGRMLASLGADVIQVEPIGGAPARAEGPFDEQGRGLWWSAYAAGKRSLALDLDTDGGWRLLDALLEASDILLASGAPVDLMSQGLDPETLSARHPRLIIVTITPFGWSGPKADWPATDITLWAAGGALAPHRDSEGPPLRIASPQAWLHAAGDAASGAMIAHFARLKMGRGQHVDISVQQAVTPAALSLISAAAVGHENLVMFPRPPARPSVDGRPPEPRGPKWRVRDGWVELGVGGGPAGARSNLLFDWMRAEGALPEPLNAWDWTKVTLAAIAAGEIQEADLNAAREAIAAFLAPRGKAELEREAINRRLLLAPVKTAVDLLESEHHAARGFFVQVEETDGARRTLPGRFAQGPTDMFAPPAAAPSVGQHSAEILSEIAGLSPGQIEAAFAEGIAA